MVLISTNILSSEIINYGGEIFDIASDARQSGMGNSGIGDNHGIASIFSNPSSLVNIEYGTMLFSHNHQFGGIVLLDLYAFQLKKMKSSSISIGIIRRGVDNIDNTQDALAYWENGVPYLDYDNITEYSHKEISMLIAYAKILKNNWKVGLLVKPMYVSISDYYGMGIGFDIGVKKDLSDNLSVGVLIRDFTTSPLFWNTNNIDVVLPTLEVGITKYLPNIILSSDISINMYSLEYFNDLIERIDYNLGCEYVWNNIVSFRIGHSNLSQLTAGVGLEIENVNFDYAFISSPVKSIFEPSHQFSIKMDLESLMKLEEIIKP
jgi:hypothetical protein